MNFGEATPIPLDTADGSKVGRDDLTPPPCKYVIPEPMWDRVKAWESFIKKFLKLKGH